jgi:hypothetical protein
MQMHPIPSVPQLRAPRERAPRVGAPAARRRAIAVDGWAELPRIGAAAAVS